MTMHEPVHHQPKTLGESAVCFACMIGLLAAATVFVQWAIHLLP